jgi:CRISPR type I-F/YPEST-associated protein Csy2
MKNYLYINHVLIQNANAMSSPYTIGFPAMTAWLGAVHALQRRLQQRGLADVFLLKTAVSCHRFNLQTYRGRGDAVYSIIGTANPLNKDGKRSSFIEEARCHLEVSFIVEVTGVNGDNKTEFLAFTREELNKMKMAGGDILSLKGIELLFVDADDEKQVKALLRKLMPGYVLIERRDLMTASMDEGKDALGALLDHIKVAHIASIDDDGIVRWNAQRKEPGWIVPIAVGFKGISGICKAKNQRDETTEHRFAESVVTLGEFKMPYRFQNVDDMMWSYSADIEQGLYVCKNQH